jgi:integrase
MWRQGELDWDDLSVSQPHKPGFGTGYHGGGCLGGLHELLVSDLGRQVLVDTLRQIEKPVMANRARAQIMKLCSFGMEHRWLQTNPANNLPKNKETKRQVILTEPQIKEIWPLLTAPLKFLLATGQRRSEVARMKWTDLQGNTWTQLDTKSGEPHSLVLPIWTMRLLPERKGIYIWRSDRSERINESTLSCQWLDASREIGADTTLHDARRTCGTYIAKLTESTDAADRVLNHAMAGITSRYVLHDFGNVKENALQLWADKLESLVADYFAQYTATPMPSSARPEGVEVM